jgi:hypothetical protein
MFVHFYMKCKPYIYGVNGIAGSKMPSGWGHGFCRNHRERWVDIGKEKYDAKGYT